MMQWFIRSTPFTKGGLRGYDALAKQAIRPCKEWTGPRDKQGYGRVFFRLPDGRIINRASRLVFYQTYGILPRGCVVKHICGNVGCVEPSHLILGLPDSDALSLIAQTKRWVRISQKELLRVRGQHAS